MSPKQSSINAYEYSSAQGQVHALTLKTKDLCLTVSLFIALEKWDQRLSTDFAPSRQTQIIVRLEPFVYSSAQIAIVFKAIFETNRGTHLSIVPMQCWTR